MLKNEFLTLFSSCLGLMLFLVPASLVGAPNQVQRGEMAGYLLVPHGRVPETYNE